MYKREKLECVRNAVSFAGCLHVIMQKDTERGQQRLLRPKTILFFEDIKDDSKGGILQETPLNFESETCTHNR